LNHYLVLTVIADDKPGLVEHLSQVISDQGGNWLESRMARLSGKFAGILKVSIDASQQQGLQEALQALESQGIRIAVESASDDTPEPAHNWHISLVGNDRPGIVHEVTRILREHHANVEELTTNCENAPMSGEVLFKANACILLPDSTDIGDLEQALEQIADELIVDIQLARQ